MATKRFYSRQLEKEKVRYVHTSGNPDRDSFKFTAEVDYSLEGSSTDHSDSSSSSSSKIREHQFDINFITLQVQAIRNNPVQLINVQETVITDTYLMYQTFPKRSDDSEIFYSIESAPQHGVLLLTQATGDFSQSQPRKLKGDSRFSQVDLLAGHLKYRLLRKAFQPLDDAFTFVVQTSDQKSAVQKFVIHHIPGDTDVDITLGRLEVEEGAKKAITAKYLNIQASDIKHFVFNVTRAPQHGQIDILASNRVDVMRSNSSFFTSEEIRDDRVVYKHDDSESRRDTFHFLATSAQTSRHDFQYLNVFHIHIILRNDQTPTRVVDKEFQVIKSN